MSEVEQSTRFMTGRIVVVEKAYHAQHDASPMLVDTTVQQALKTSEQPFRRKLIIGEDWVNPFSQCWLERSSMLFILNEEGRNLQTIPMPDEQEVIDARVVEVKLRPDDEGFMPLIPGGSLRFSPGDLKGIRLRCRSGQARVLINVFPE